VTEVASFMSDFWREELVETERQGLFLVLVGFIGSFAFIRMSTRIARSPRASWWPGSIVSEGGVHLHHLVFGIWLMIGAGTIGFWLLGESPWFEVCALLFGVGAGLTVDEFALWVYLDDVYWAERGRSSVDATVIAVALMLLVLLGIQPVEFETGSFGLVALSVAVILLSLALVTTCFLKQRLMHGMIGIFFFPIALYGAVRIAKPGSPWARRRYAERNPRKQAEAQQRFRADRRTERFKERFRDAVGGAPTEVYERKLALRAGTQEAVQDVRDRAAAADERDATGDSGAGRQDSREAEPPSSRISS
jgi:hypothetical protein